MALKQILTRVCAGAGLSNALDNVEQKEVIIAVINIAAEEIYESLDLPECLREICVQVTPDSQLALPPYVGEIRALRDRSLKQPWTLLDLRPRYHEFSWKESWKNFRHKGYSPLCTSITNAAPLVFTIPVADNSTVTVTGATANARKVVDTVTMDDTAVVGTESFLSIESITKTERNDYDIGVYDAGNNLLATLYNDWLQSRYILLDVSQYPAAHCGTYTVFEVLYKLPLRYMEEDGDTFPADNYDAIIGNKALQLIMETEDGKELRATYFQDRTEKLLKAKIADKLEGESKPIDFKPHAVYRVMDGMSKLPYSRGRGRFAIGRGF